MTNINIKRVSFEERLQEIQDIKEINEIMLTEQIVTDILRLAEILSKDSVDKRRLKKEE